MLIRLEIIKTFIFYCSALILSACSFEFLGDDSKDDSPLTENAISEKGTSPSDPVSAEEQCNRFEGMRWDAERKSCYDEHLMITSREECESNPKYLWSEQNSACFPTYHEISSKEACETTVGMAWSDENVACFQEFKTLSSEVECLNTPGFRWLADANGGEGACLEDHGILCPEDFDFDGTTCLYNLGLNEGNPAPSCKSIKEFNPSSADGAYWLQGASNVAFQSFCDMTSDGGGWTLVARISNNDDVSWLDASIWYSRTETMGNPLNRDENSDAFSEAFWAVMADNLKISRSDNDNDSHLLITSNNFLSKKSFRAFWNEQLGIYSTGSWAVDQSRFSVPVSFGNNYMDTDGFQQADCTGGNVGQESSLNFLSDWLAGDGSVIMIGQGGANCERADHGIGTTEVNNALWGDTSDNPCDFGYDGLLCSNSYSLNVFVK